MTITETMARAMPFHIGLDLRRLMAKAAITALTEAGYTIVPVEPTEAMVDSAAKLPVGWRTVTDEGDSVHANDVEGVWSAMIAAAPDHIMPPIQEPGPLESGEGE